MFELQQLRVIRLTQRLVSLTLNSILTSQLKEKLRPNSSLPVQTEDKQDVCCLSSGDSQSSMSSLEDKQSEETHTQVDQSQLSHRLVSQQENQWQKCLVAVQPFVNALTSSSCLCSTRGRYFRSASSSSEPKTGNEDRGPSPLFSRHWAATNTSAGTEDTEPVSPPEDAHVSGLSVHHEGHFIISQIWQRFIHNKCKKRTKQREVKEEEDCKCEQTWWQCRFFGRHTRTSCPA